MDMTTDSHTINELRQKIALLEETNSELTNRIRVLSLRDREKTALLSTLFERAPFGIMMLDSRRHIIQMNNVAATLFSKQPQQAIGLSCEQLVNCYQQHGCCPVFDRKEHLDQHRTGCLNCDHILLRSTVLSSDMDDVILIETFIDITALEKAHISHTLALQAKSNFLSNISHELRTPMHGILGYGELLNSMAEDLPAEGREYTKAISESADRLWRLIERLLDAASLEEDSIQLQRIDINLCEMFADLQNDLSPLVKEQDNRIHFSCDETIDVVRGDPLRLQQVLINLLRNANKFTQGGEINCVAKPLRHNQQRQIEITISDTGIGIAKDKQQRIFDLFEQADGSTSREYQGAGLGLAISRRLVLLMGGSIELQSEMGKGTEFRLVIPA